MVMMTDTSDTDTASASATCTATAESSCSSLLKDNGADDAKEEDDVGTSSSSTGVLDLSHQNLTLQGWKGTLIQLGGSRSYKYSRPGRRCRAARKCRRSEDQIIQSSLLVARVLRSSSSNCNDITLPVIWKLNVAGNPDMGDDAMNFLPWIPDSVRVLDVSHCGLTDEGIVTLCRFLAHNNTLTRVVLGSGGLMSQNAANVVGQMLAKNDTLHELCIHLSPSVLDDSPGYHNQGSISAVALQVGQGLRTNRALRHLRYVVHYENFPTMRADEEFFLYAQAIGYLHEDSRLETLHFGRDIDRAAAYAAAYAAAPAPADATVSDIVYSRLHSTLHQVRLMMWGLLLKEWLRKLEKNEHLQWIGAGNLSPLLTGINHEYYLDLNKYHARRLVRDPRTSHTELLHAITRASEDNKLNAVYFLIRNMPEALLDGRQ